MGEFLVENFFKHIINIIFPSQGIDAPELVYKKMLEIMKNYK